MSDTTSVTLTLHQQAVVVGLSVHTPDGVLEVGTYDSISGVFTPGKDSDEASRFFSENIKRLAERRGHKIE